MTQVGTKVNDLSYADLRARYAKARAARPSRVLRDALRDARYDEVITRVYNPEGTKVLGYIVHGVRWPSSHPTYEEALAQAKVNAKTLTEGARP